MNGHFFDPLAELSRLEGQLHHVSRATREDRRDRRLQPAIDVLERGDEIVVMAELPGVTPQDVRVHIDGMRVTIRGHRTRVHEEIGAGYHRMETSCGSFKRSFSLPTTVDPTNADASFADGILTLRLTKRPRNAS